MAKLDGSFISASGDYRLSTLPGQRYALAIGDREDGTITVGWVSARDTVIAFDDSPIAAGGGGFEFVAPSAEIQITLADDASGYNIAVHLTPIN